MQFMRYCKYNVVVFCWKQFTHAIINPLISFSSSTIRTMSITTAVILLMNMTAIAVVAFKLMDTNFFGMAFT